MLRFLLSLFVLILCLACSVGGIWYAIHESGCDADAGRGGAIADALALAFVFLGRAYAFRLFTLKMRLDQKPAESTKQINESEAIYIARQELSSFLRLVNGDQRYQAWQNGFMALGTVIGTLAWGFGDIIAYHYLHHHCTS
jgi:hypothetical protein